MRNNRNQWQNAYSENQREWEEENNREWRPTQYRRTNGPNTNDYGRAGSFRQQANYEQGIGYGSENPYEGRQAYEDNRFRNASYGSNRSYPDYGSNAGQHPFNRFNAQDQERYNRFENRNRGFDPSGYSNERSYGSGTGYNRDYHQDAARARNAYNQRNEEMEDGHDRDFWDKAGDEVASWFGDDEARRRREMDQRSELSSSHWSGASYRGKGPKNYKRSDARIQEDINDRLSDDPFIDASDIDVTVSDGEVILSGSVRDRSAKRRAEDLAESISGISNVENRIRITTG